MKGKTALQNIESTIATDSKSVFTLLSFVAVLLIFINMVYVKSVVLGFLSSIAYFVVNAVFLGNAVFSKENAHVRFTLGSLLLTVSIGLIGWTALIAYNLSIEMSALVLSVVAVICALANKLSRYKFKIEFFIER